MTAIDFAAAAFRFALNSILAALTLDPTRDVEDLKNEREAAAAMLGELKPLDAIQAAYAARAVIAHHASMECFRRAAMADATDAVRSRMFACGMALCRQSSQMTKALEQRKKGAARPGTSADPIEAILASTPAHAAAREVPAGQPQPSASASRPAAGPQAPMPAEPASCEPVAKDPVTNEPRPAVAAAVPPAAMQKPMHQSAHPSAASARLAQTTAWTGRPIITREEIAAMTGLPVSMIPAAPANGSSACRFSRLMAAGAT